MSVLINFYGWSWKHWLLIQKWLPFQLQRRQSQPRPNKIILIKRLRRSNNFPKGDQNGQKVKATVFTFRKTLPNVLRNRKRNLSFNIFRQKIVLKFKLAFLQFSLLLYFLFDKYLMTLKVVNVYLWVSLAFRDSWLLTNRGCPNQDLRLQLGLSNFRFLSPWTVKTLNTKTTNSEAQVNKFYYVIS